MIYEIGVTNPSGERLPLTLAGPELSGLAVVDVLGLGPAKSNVSLRENATASGSIFKSVKTPSRNIVLTLRFLESPSIEAARLRTYKFFPSESLVLLDVTTDAGTFFICGFVESNEPNIFSSEEGCVISVVCPEPFFRSADGHVIEAVDNVIPMFEFPFEGLDPDNLIFGELILSTSGFTIPKTGSFDGTVDIGLILRMRVNGGQVINPTIHVTNANYPTEIGRLEFIFTEALPPLDDGDYLVINCKQYQKSITRYMPDGESMNYLATLTPDSSWPKLRRGANVVSYLASFGREYISFSYEYELQYVGV